MGLFKHFIKRKKEPEPEPTATKDELNAFKMKLTLGDDPNFHWKKQKKLWDEYLYHKQTAFELLRKLYRVKEVSTRGHYTKLEVWIFSHTGECEKSPIGEHVFMNHYGDNNPDKGKPKFCLACGKELKI